MTRRTKHTELAIDGGDPVATAPPPPRGLLSSREKDALGRLFDRAIAAGKSIGYNGPEEEAYCREFAEYIGRGYADAVNSGTNALYVALRALELPPFTEVIVPPITDAGGMMPVPLMNCIPVVADAEPGGFNMGAEQIAARITPRTTAVVVAHIAGEPADMAPIMKLARSRKLPVIEDCSQSHGARYRGRPVGSFGVLSVFSTMFGKHHCTGGQGGVVFTKSKDLHMKSRRYADRGKPFGLDVTENVAASLNMNLTEIGACIGRVQLSKLPRIVERRRRVAHVIREGAAGLTAVYAPHLPRGAEPSYWFLRMGLDASRLTVTKERFCKAVAAECGVGISPSYAAFPSLAPWFVEQRVFGEPGMPWTAPQYKGDRRPSYDLPNALGAVQGSFRIAVHEGLRVSDARNVVRALAKVEAAYIAD